MRKEEHTIKLTLLDNGIDFILKGIDELFDDKYFLSDYKSPTEFPNQNYKYGCLHVFAGFLLLLKERLARHLPELIYEGKLKDIRGKLDNNKFPNTVGFDELLDRLEVGPKVTFSEEEIKVIRRMQTIRNTLEHAKFEKSKHEIWQVLSNFLEIVDRFLVEELKIEIEKKTNSDKLINKIRKIDNIWKRIRIGKEGEIRASLRINLADFKKEKKSIVERLEAEEIELSLEGVSIFNECSECQQDGLITEGNYKGICIRCESVNSLTNCIRCRGFIVGFYWDFNFCDACKDEISKE